MTKTPGAKASIWRRDQPFAAVLVTNLDIKSLIVRDEAPMPTHTSSSSIYVLIYDLTISFSESSAVKTVFVLDYVLERPTAGMPRLEATQLQLAAIRSETATEKATKLDARREKHEAVDSLNLYNARRRFEAIKNHLETQLNDAIEEKIGLSDELKTNKEIDEDTGNSGAKDDEEQDVEKATSEKQDLAGRLPYNRSDKLRSNKRPDGSIYTSKHPQSTPLEQQGVGA
ncbi:MAG: hypothetical protein ASARMPREDX12_006817 [Alectoria sarmentosa]|nr:MAG: hypothetical protein ASARMPREDX12_006817 [Alectoria sarmentosa]